MVRLPPQAKPFAPTLSMQAQKASDSQRREKGKGRRPIFESGSNLGLRVRSAFRRNTTEWLRSTRQDTRVRHPLPVRWTLSLFFNGRSALDAFFLRGMAGGALAVEFAAQPGAGQGDNGE